VTDDIGDIQIPPISNGQYAFAVASSLRSVITDVQNGKGMSDSQTQDAFAALVLFYLLRQHANPQRLAHVLRGVIDEFDTTPEQENQT
jgi:hypothetical protein